MAERKHFLSWVPDVDVEIGEVSYRENPVETQGVMSLDTAADEFRAVAVECGLESVRSSRAKLARS